MGWFDMKKVLVLATLGLVALPVFACSSTSSDDGAGAPSSENGAPGDGANAAEDPDASGAAPAATDPCACPASCDSPSEKSWKICNPPAAAPDPAKVPPVEKIGAFSIGNFEYWPYKFPNPYPDNTICGFNGEQECGWNGPAKGPPPEAAKKCMFEARKVLVDILKNPPPELVALKSKRGVFKFWNWNNDMTDAPAKRVASSRYLWLYDGTRGDGGLIKWISETERDGTCHLPTRESLVKFASNCVETFPNCRE